MPAGYLGEGKITFVFSKTSKFRFLRVYIGVRTCDIFSASLARAGVWLLLNGLLALLFSLFYVIREFDRFLHQG